jgi:hypothetical protein
MILLAIKSSSLPPEAIGTMAYMIGVRLNTRKMSEDLLSVKKK